MRTRITLLGALLAIGFGVHGAPGAGAAVRACEAECRLETNEIVCKMIQGDGVFEIYYWT